MQAAAKTRSDWHLFVGIGFLASTIFWIVLLTLQHQTARKKVSESRAAGVASTQVGWDETALWRQQSSFDFARPQYRRAAYVSEPHPADDGRRIVRHAELGVRVTDIARFQHAGAALAEGLGGYVVRATQVDAKDGGSSLQVRVPKEHFLAAVSDLQRLAAQVERVHIQAADVTKEYVDFEANLRNLRAEESQYISILKQARTVEETVLVTEKLVNVRGRIEKTQAEFEYLQGTIALSSITVEMRSEAVVRAFGVDWKPGLTVHRSFQGMLQGLANFADAMVFLIFRLPVLLLWLMVIAGALLGSARLMRRFKAAWNRRLSPVVDAELR